MQTLIVSETGTYQTIQDALDAASDGDVIEVAAGVYQENIVIDKAVTITGAGDDTVIMGSFKSENGVADDASVADFLKTAPSYLANAGTGVRISASDVTLQNLRIYSFNTGVDLSGIVDNITLDGVTVEATVNGIRKGSGSQVTNLTMQDGTITDSYIGMYIAKETASGLDAVGVTIDGTAFTHLVEKGIYAETLSDALITGITMTDVGQYGRGPAFGGLGSFGGGIDINLKWDREDTTDAATDNDAPYSNITIQDFIFTGVGTSDRDGTDDATAHSGGAAIAVKTRDAGAYASPEQATFSGSVVIQNGTIDGTSTGIRAGEPGQNIAGPAVSVSNVTITNAVHNTIHGDVANVTQSTVTIDLSDGNDTQIAAGNSTGAFVFNAKDGDDVLAGAGGTDSAIGYGAGATLSIVEGHWTITDGADVDTLSGIERVLIGTTTYLLVDQLGTDGGFQSVQAAINAATGGETILIAPGTYAESAAPTEASPIAGGLYINKPNLSLLGVDENGALITTAAAAQASGATIVSAHQSDFGSNHFVGVNGTNTVISGLHLQAGAATNNKLLEIWADNVTVENSFIDVDAAGTGYSYAAAIYFNDNGSSGSDTITSYTISGNILNEGIIVANGVGDPSGGISSTQLITDNQFVGHFDNETGEGRYDTVVINGEVSGIGWLLEPSQTPTISGNSFGDGSTPFVMRGSDNDPVNLPSSAQVAAILADNEVGPYAYVLTPEGELRTAMRNDGAGEYHSFAVTNTIDTLNLALDDTPDNVFGGQRDYILAGDTIVVQGATDGPTDAAIMVDNLTVLATATTSDLNLFLATHFADGSAIPGPGVETLTLADYALGQGANVDVTGNDLANILIGNSGNNLLDGGVGPDALSGGGGNDVYILDDDGDVVTELAYGGTDEVRSVISMGLGANVENLTLLDGASDTQTFDDMELGVIANGENGWKVVSGVRDQEIVDQGGGDHAFRMSSDPGISDFAGPYSPGLALSAGEPSTTAQYSGQSIKFNIQAVSATPDGSRLEIDFGNAAGTDRNNFLVIESFTASGGLRVAVSEPLPNGDFTGNNSDPAPNDWRELISNVDASVTHKLEMRLTYVDAHDSPHF